MSYNKDTPNKQDDFRKKLSKKLNDYKNLDKIPYDEIFRDLSGTPNEIPLSTDKCVIEQIVSNSPSYKKALRSYSLENLEKMHSNSDKLLDAVQVYRIREILFHNDKFQGNLFMLNLKDSSRTSEFFELSYKGGAESGEDKNIFSAMHRERNEELKNLRKYLSPKSERLKGFYYNILSDEKENSDILIQKNEDEQKIQYIINSIVTKITEVDKIFFPELTEHRLTIWQPLETVIEILKDGAEKTGNDKDFFIAKDLLPYLNFQEPTNVIKIPELIKGTNYLRLPDNEYVQSI